MDDSQRITPDRRAAGASRAPSARPARLALLLCLGLLSLASCSQGPNKNLVFTQLSQVLTTGPASNTIAQRANTNQFASTQQYSIWGWFRYNGATKINSNLLVLKQAANSNAPAANPAFPACPYTPDQLNKNPSLMALSGIALNPNCFQTGAAGATSTWADLLYVNFNFYPANGAATSKFDLIFLIQNGVLNGTSIMNMEGFTNEPLQPNTWVFFAVSLDYSKNLGAIYFQPFDGQGSPGRLKNVALNFPGFKLTPNLQLSLASTSKNPYMVVTDPFLGQIGFVEIALFYTSQLNLMWMGYTPNQTPSWTPNASVQPAATAPSKAVSSDIVFSTGFPNALTDSVSNRKYPIRGGCSPIQGKNGGKIGLNFYTNSSVPFVNFQRANSENPVQSLTFFLQFSYTESLPANFVIVQKGTQGVNSYLTIALNQGGAAGVVGGPGRVFVVAATNAGQTATWTSPNSFQPGVTYSVIIGVASDLASGLYVIYMDASRSLFPLIRASFPFDLNIDNGANMLFLFNNQNSGAFNGVFSFYRFVLLNSASTAIYNALVSLGQQGTGVNGFPTGPISGPGQSVNITVNNYGYGYGGNDGGYRYGGYDDFGRNWQDGGNGGFNYNNTNPGVFNPNGCILGSSYYDQSNYCLLCPNGQVSTLSGNCVSSCPAGYATFGGSICLPCLDAACTQPSPTIPNNGTTGGTGGSGTNGTLAPLTWTIQEVDNQYYRIIPSRPVLNGTVDPYQLVKVNLTGQAPGTGYNLTNDLTNQWIDFRLNLPQGVYYDKRINMFINGTNFSSISNGTNATVYSYPNDYLSNNGTWNYSVYQICNLSGEERTRFNALAITLLVMFAVAFLALLAVTCCCWSRMWDLGGLWKYWLHLWIRLTFVAFLLVLGVYLPCCLRQFLNILYLVGVRWDQAFSEIINSVYGGSTQYWSGVYNYSPPMNFRQVGVFAFILHNMMIAFIIHLFIFTIWIVVMIWDCAISTRGRCMYFTYAFMQFTVLVVAYGFFCMHAWVFAALNIRSTPFTHHYFIICFVIAILYIAVFVVFWLYAAFRLCGSSFYFLDEIHYANFYYFFAGYRESRLARTYDLFYYLCFFACGLAIGFLWDVPIAQLVIILVALVCLLLITILMHPWRYWLINVVEWISIGLLVIVAAMLLAIAIYDRTSCFWCGNRESSMCWALVALLFLALLLPLLALIIQALMSACCADRFRPRVRTYPAEEAYYGYTFGEQRINNVVTTNVVTTQNTNAMRRDVENVVVTDQAAERLISAEDYCAACRTSMATCPTHGRAVVTEQRIEGYDAKRSMLDFMNELRAKRIANNQKVKEMETRNYATNMDDNIDIVETRNRANSYTRRANQMAMDRADEEYKQSRVVSTLERVGGETAVGTGSGVYSRNRATYTTTVGTTGVRPPALGGYTTTTSASRVRTSSRSQERSPYDDYKLKRDL